MEQTIFKTRKGSEISGIINSRNELVGVKLVKGDIDDVVNSLRQDLASPNYQDRNMATMLLSTLKTFKLI